jgi:hypothetical protein
MCLLKAGLWLPNLPVEAIWISSVFRALGGGPGTAFSMLVTMGADISNEKTRYAVRMWAQRNTTYTRLLSQNEDILSDLHYHNSYITHWITHRFFILEHLDLAPLPTMLLLFGSIISDTPVHARNL